MPTKADEPGVLLSRTQVLAFERIADFGLRIAPEFQLVDDPDASADAVRHLTVEAKLTHEQTDEVVSDLSVLTKPSFWIFLDNCSWCHPYDERGVRREFSAIPKALKDLLDDPFRSLASAGLAASPRIRPPSVNFFGRISCATARNWRRSTATLPARSPKRSRSLAATVRTVCPDGVASTQ
jgi:hypothetical protein